MSGKCPDCGAELEGTRCPQCQPSAAAAWDDIEAGWELDQEEEEAAEGTDQADAAKPRPRRTRVKRKKGSKARGGVDTAPKPKGSPVSKRDKRPPREQESAAVKTKPNRPRPWLVPLLVFVVALAAFVLVLIAAAN